MKGDAKVIDYLNKGLRSELTAVNQYWLHYRLLDNWGYKDLAKKWRKESIEEMEHADKFVERIISSTASRTCRSSIHCISARTSKRCWTVIWRQRRRRVHFIRKRRPTATASRTTSHAICSKA